MYSFFSFSEEQYKKHDCVERNEEQEFTIIHSIRLKMRSSGWERGTERGEERREGARERATEKWRAGEGEPWRAGVPHYGPPRPPAGACLWSITLHFTTDTSRKGSSGIPQGRPVETQERYASSSRKEVYLQSQPFPHERGERAEGAG